MNEVDVIEGIDCYLNGVICDEAIIYRIGRFYYIEYVGLGKKRKISKKVYDTIKETKSC